MKPLFIDPPNTIMSIDRLWLYISRDADGNEGVLAATMPNGVFAPLIAADEARLQSLTPIAEAMAITMTDKKIVLVEFTARNELREIKGRSS